MSVAHHKFNHKTLSPSKSVPETEGQTPPKKNNKKLPVLAQPKLTTQSLPESASSYTLAVQPNPPSSLLSSNSSISFDHAKPSVIQQNLTIWMYQEGLVQITNPDEIDHVIANLADKPDYRIQYLHKRFAPPDYNLEKVMVIELKNIQSPQNMHGMEGKYIFLEHLQKNFSQIIINKDSLVTSDEHHGKFLKDYEFKNNITLCTEKDVIVNGKNYGQSFLPLYARLNNNPLESFGGLAQRSIHLIQSNDFYTCPCKAISFEAYQQRLARLGLSLESIEIDGQHYLPLKTESELHELESYQKIDQNQELLNQLKDNMEEIYQELQTKFPESEISTQKYPIEAVILEGIRADLKKIGESLFSDCQNAQYLTVPAFNLQFYQRQLANVPKTREQLAALKQQYPEIFYDKMVLNLKNIKGLKQAVDLLPFINGAKEIFSTAVLQKIAPNLHPEKPILLRFESTKAVTWRNISREEIGGLKDAYYIHFSGESKDLQKLSQELMKNQIGNNEFILHRDNILFDEAFDVDFDGKKYHHFKQHMYDHLYKLCDMKNFDVSNTHFKNFLHRHAEKRTSVIQFANMIYHSIVQQDFSLRQMPENLKRLGEHVVKLANDFKTVGSMNIEANSLRQLAQDCQQIFAKAKAGDIDEISPEAIKGVYEFFSSILTHAADPQNINIQEVITAFEKYQSNPNHEQSRAEKKLAKNKPVSIRWYGTKGLISLEIKA